MHVQVTVSEFANSLLEEVKSSDCPLTVRKSDSRFLELKTHNLVLYQEIDEGHMIIGVRRHEDHFYPPENNEEAEIGPRFLL